jgi:hypothetical protein
VGHESSVLVIIDRLAKIPNWAQGYNMKQHTWHWQGGKKKRKGPSLPMGYVEQADPSDGARWRRAHLCGWTSVEVHPASPTHSSLDRSFCAWAGFQILIFPLFLLLYIYIYIIAFKEQHLACSCNKFNAIWVQDHMTWNYNNNNKLEYSS